MQTGRALRSICSNFMKMRQTARLKLAGVVGENHSQRMNPPYNTVEEDRDISQACAPMASLSITYSAPEHSAKFIVRC